MIETSQDIDRYIRELPFREANALANLQAIYTTGTFGPSLKEQEAPAE